MALRALTGLLLSALATLPGLALGQVIDGGSAVYDAAPNSRAPASLGVTVLTLATDPSYAAAIWGLPETRAPQRFVGVDERGTLLAACEEGLLSVSADGRHALRLTATALAEAGLAADLAGQVAGVDALGWLYLADAQEGVRRIAVTQPLRSVYLAAQLASAAFTPLAPLVDQILPLPDGRLLLAAGPSGLLEGSTSGVPLRRSYDPYIDAESAQRSGQEAALRGLSLSPLGEPVLAVSLPEGTWIGVLTEAGLRRVGEGPLVPEPILPRGIAHLGDGGYLALAESGLHWFDLNGNSAPLSDLAPVASALRAVGVVDDEPRIQALYDGCGGQALLVLEQGALLLSAGPREVVAGDALLALPEQQAVLRLVEGRYPQPLFDGAPLANPAQAILGPRGRLWVVDPGAQTVFVSDEGLRTLSAQRGPAGSPRALAFDADARPVLLDLALQGAGPQRPGLVRLPASPEGEEQTLAAGAPFISPSAFVVGPDGRAYVADEAAATIWRVALEPDALPETFATLDAPRALALGPDGDLWVLTRPAGAQATLYQVDETGQPTPRHVGDPLSRPAGLAVDAAGTVFVADGRSDPFPSQPAGRADTGALFVLAAGADALRPRLDSALLPRSVADLGLSIVAGSPEPSCRLGPQVRPPARDPLASPSEDSEADGGCALGRSPRGRGSAPGFDWIGLLSGTRRR